MPPLNAIKTNVITNIDDHLESITNSVDVVMCRNELSEPNYAFDVSQTIGSRAFDECAGKKLDPKVEEMRLR